MLQVMIFGICCPVAGKFSLEKKDMIGRPVDFLWETPDDHAANQIWRVERTEDKFYIFSREKVLRIQNEKLLDVFGEFTGYLFLFLDVTLEAHYKNKLIEDANTDYLTNLNNRRRLHEFMSLIDRQHARELH